MTCGPRHGLVADAIDELAGLRSTDPAAGAAIDAVKLTQFMLETFWADPAEDATHPRRA